MRNQWMIVVIPSSKRMISSTHYRRSTRQIICWGATSLAFYGGFYWQKTLHLYKASDDQKCHCVQTKDSMTINPTLHLHQPVTEQNSNKRPLRGQSVWRHVMWHLGNDVLHTFKGSVIINIFHYLRGSSRLQTCKVLIAQEVTVNMVEGFWAV